MSASLDFKRTFQYSQALYSVVRFSLKLFINNNRDSLRFLQVLNVLFEIAQQVKLFIHIPERTFCPF